MMEEAHDNSKPVIVRVKRKPDQCPLQAFWLEINERPLKRPLLDFEKLSIAASTSTSSPSEEELKIRRVLVQHVETLSTSQATVDFLHSFVGATSSRDPKFKASSKERKRALQKENKHDQLLSKAKQEQEDLAKNARFEQIWKRRGSKEVNHDESVGEVCRVYDVLRVDTEDTSRMEKQQEKISLEDQEALNKFLPLLRECIPSAAKEIESDISDSVRQDSTDDYVYDLYAVKEKIDETEEDIPFFPLVQLDDDAFYDGTDDYTDDSNAENNSLNEYPDEESSENDEEESERSGSESEVESETLSDRWIGSDDSE